ncbi:MAG: RluA family pseudouridine synthase [Bacteroidales bacterium]|jgi:23S rRNA pseudouridine1911/1915/1917 synthase|nr:RluA family pseudouridine synthase [Bacteroidales bacterium]
MDLEILYEDNHIIAINKPNNILVQPDTSGDVSLEELVKRYIKEKYNKPGEVFLGVPHRLDRPVSGVILFARTTKALTRLNEMFKTKDIHKIYWAIVKQQPNPETALLRHYIVRNTKTNKSTAHATQVPDSKEALLTYSTLARSTTYTLLEVQLHTGRHHQIRSQLAAIGSPIKGDLKYGFSRSNEGGGISLHARRVEFIHPVSKQSVRIEAHVPNDTLWQAMSELVGE